MSPTLRQACCDAFNLLQQNNALHPDALYQLVEDSNRHQVLRSIRDFVEVPEGYSPIREYVMLWIPTEAHPFSEMTWLEAHDFARMGERLQFRLLELGQGFHSAAPMDTH